MRAAAVLGLLVLAAPAPPAAASFLDSILCQTTGCVVVVGDAGLEVWVLDAPSGQPASLLHASGAVRAVETGTLRAPTPPGPGQGERLAIDTQGSGRADLPVPDVDRSGFLDAADVAPAFAVTAAARLDLLQAERRTSFWLCSSRDFDVYARARPSGSELERRLSLSDLSLAVALDAAGDDGFAYGGSATTAGFEPEPGIDDLGDVAAGPVRVARVGATSAGPSPRLFDQCVRFDVRYGVRAGVDLALGTGEIRPRVEYTIHVR